MFPISLLHAHLSACLTVRKNQSTKCKLWVSQSVYTTAVYHCIALFICSCCGNSVGGLINFLSRWDLFGLTCWTCASQTAAEFTFTSRYHLRSSADYLSNHQSSFSPFRGKDLRPLFKITFKFKMKNYLTKLRKLWQIEHQSRPSAGRTKGKLTGGESRCYLRPKKLKRSPLTLLRVIMWRTTKHKKAAALLRKPAVFHTWSYTATWCLNGETLPSKIKCSWNLTTHHTHAPVYMYF